MTFSKGEQEKKYEKMTTATLDEAMLLAGFGSYNILHMLMSGVILMGMIMQSLALGYVLPAAQCDLDLTLQQRGWLSAIPFAAIILTSFFWGWLADTQGRRPIMLTSMLLSAILSVFASFAPDLISFAILQFLAAVFTSGSSAVVYTYLGEFNSLRHRDKMVAFGSSFVGIGTVVLPCISWLILPLDFAFPIDFLGIQYRPWRLLIVAFAMPFAIGTILLFFAPESPKFLSATGQPERALEVVKTIYAGNHRSSRDDFEVKNLVVEVQTTKSTSTGLRAILTSMKEQTLPLFKMPFLPWICLVCFVQFGIFAATNGFYVWFPSILNSLANHGGSETKICDVLDASKVPAGNGTEIICDDTMNTATFERSIYIGLVFSSMYLIVGFLVDFVGKKLILITVLGITGLCGVGAHLAYNQQVAVVLFAIFQMSGACIGLMNAVAVEIFPTKFRAMAICLGMMMGRVGSMVGSNLIGVFLEVNCGAGFYMFGSLLVGISWLILPLDFAFPIDFLGIQYRPWRLLIVAFAMPFAIGTILLFFAPESPKFLSATGQPERALEVVKTIYAGNHRSSRDDFEVKNLVVEVQTTKSTSTGLRAILTSMKEQTLPLFKMPFLPWICLVCFVQFGIFAATNGFYVWFPSILNSLANHGGSETKICDVLDASKVPAGNGTEIICDDTMNTATFERSIYIGLVFSSMYLIVGFLVDFVGKKLILITVLGITGLCGVGAHLAYNQQVAVVLFAIFQMSGACIGLMNAVAVEIFPTKFRAMAICLGMMMGRVGSMVGSNLIGVFLEVNCGAGFYMFGSLLVANAIFCITLPNKKKEPKSSKEMTVEPTQNQTHEPV